MSIKDLTTGETRYLTIYIYFPGDIAPFVEQYPFNGSLAAFLKNSTFATNPEYAHIVVDLLKKGDVKWTKKIANTVTTWRVAIKDKPEPRRWLDSISPEHLH